MTTFNPHPAVDIDQGLHQLGFDAFRPGQREAVETLLSDGRLLLVAPTGGGKSLTYQLPALLLPGTTLVISPLISLMQDQVAALEARGIAATFLASTLDGETMRQRLARLAQGHYKLVYVAPERLAFSGFRTLLRHLECPLVAIDEAHCISEWGHDFRPDYMQIGKLLEHLPQARVLACTATATPVVRDEILERLKLPPDTPQVLRGFARPNLALRVCELESRKQRRQRVDALLAEVLGPDRSGTAIIYAPTRRTAEDEAQRLAAAGWRAAAYHAGLDGPVRQTVQEEFAAGHSQVVVATNAFGMGIDRPDVRAVIHLAPPGSVEAYYQEVGRAGRDGADSVCLLFVASGDMALRRHLIDSDVENLEGGDEVAQHKWNLFLELMRWAEGGSCRHDAILRYFGDEAELLAGCGRCDVCQQLEGPSQQDPDQVETIVRKALCAVARVHGRFGLQTAVKLLHGDPDPRLRRVGLTKTPTFGTLSNHSNDWLLRLLRRCIAAGWVDFHGGDRPVVIVTQAGMDVIRQRRPAKLLLPSKSTTPRRSPATPSPKPALAPPRHEADFDQRAQQLFDALRQHRLQLARAQEVPPYVIASDRTLRDIATLRPNTVEELLLAHGIGPSKAERYGDSLLAIVRGTAPE